MLTVFWLLTPFPGTTLFEEMEAAGRVEHHKWSLFDAAHLVFQPKHISKDQMLEAYWKAFQQVYSLKYCQQVNTALQQIGDFSHGYFLQIYSRKKVFSLQTPFSGGIESV